MASEQTHRDVFYMVESYWPGVTGPAALAKMRLVQQAAETVTGRDGEVRFVTSYLMSQDEVAFCMFEATSPSAVEEACHLAELPFDRVVSVVQIDAE